MTDHVAPVRRALVLMDGLERSRRPMSPDDHPAFRLVGGLPVADCLVRHLAAQGIVEICLAVHELPGLVVHYFAQGAPWGVRITYAYEQRPLGSAGAMAQAASFCSETTLVVPGSLVANVAVPPLTAAHRNSGSSITAVVAHPRGGRPRPLVVVGDDGIITHYLPRTDVSPGPDAAVDAGVYLVEPGLLQRIPKDTFVDWTRDLMPQLVRERLVRGWMSDAVFLHVATAEDARLAGETPQG